MSVGSLVGSLVGTLGQWVLQTFSDLQTISEPLAGCRSRGVHLWVTNLWDTLSYWRCKGCHLPCLIFKSLRLQGCHLP